MGRRRRIYFSLGLEGSELSIFGALHLARSTAGDGLFEGGKFA